MRRREFIGCNGHIIVYVIDDYVSASEIISELCRIGCKGKELTRAYKVLISDNPDYTYTNKDSGDTLIVVGGTHSTSYTFNVILV